MTSPTQLSTESFESSIHHLAPKVAVFDCDGTLWSGDAGSGFMIWSIETGLISSSAVEWLNARYQLYKEGHNSELAICAEMVQVYRGLPESTLRAAAAEFFRTRIEPHIFPELAHIVATLQSTGTDIWAASSTCDWVIEEGVRRFNIPANRVLAARVAVEDGIITDKILDVPTDQGKVDSLFRAGIAAPDAVFGNSIHDAHMLAIARQAYPVNPTPALLARAATEGWPVYFPASVRPS